VRDHQSKERDEMAMRQKSITNVPDADEPAPVLLGQSKRPETGQFWLQVDRQTKASYVTYEAAEQAGLAIKQGHPIVQVAVYDSVGGANTLLEVPKA
jgi:hypothetical protein